MGRKSAARTLATIVVAFLQQPTWGQPELARRCEVTPRALRRAMLELAEAGFRFERDEEAPSEVYWSRLPDWLPGRGTGLASEDTTTVARLVARLPKSETRDRILAEIVRHALGAPSVASDMVSDVTEAVLATLEDAARQRLTVKMGYYSASRDQQAIRFVSVQRIVYGDRLRFVAHCHRSGALRWFRVDRVTQPSIERAPTFVAVATGELDAFVRESVDGYRGEGVAEACRFFVRTPEAHWMVRNLPRGLAQASVQIEEGGVRVMATCAASDVLARFLVGAGDAVREIEPAALRTRVRTIAQAAIAASELGARERDGARRGARTAAEGESIPAPEARGNKSLVRAIPRGDEAPDRIGRGE